MKKMRNQKKAKERPFSVLGINVANRRGKLEWSQAELITQAALRGLKIPSSSLADIERGVREGHLNTRLAIAKTLGCSLADLYLEPEPKPAYDFDDASEFLRRASRLDPEPRGLVLALVFGRWALAEDCDLPAAVEEYFRTYLE